jgi:hypothetical protein
MVAGLAYWLAVMGGGPPWTMYGTVGPVPVRGTLEMGVGLVVTGITVVVGRVRGVGRYTVTGAALVTTGGAAVVLGLLPEVKNMTTSAAATRTTTTAPTAIMPGVTMKSSLPVLTIPVSLFAIAANLAEGLSAAALS